MSNLNSGKTLPLHVAIIMDGNGRWAAQRKLPRTAGHRQGVEATKRIVRAAAEQGIAYLTLFGFSSENWKRPEDEIRELMKLLRHYLRGETADLHKNGVRLRVIGDRTAFDADIVELIGQAERLTQSNTKLNLNIALNYGGRQDIANAAHAMIEQAVKEGVVPARVEMQERLKHHLMTAYLPDPDLLIRTSGEKRISNFLLWQCAYAEFVFTDTLWPDFDATDLQAALEEYQTRDRRFGALRRAMV